MSGHEISEQELDLIEQITGLRKLPDGICNVRLNGKLLFRNNGDKIRIETKKDKEGIDIFVGEGVKGTVSIPVLLSANGFSDAVYNDFYIGKNADVTIESGCGIHNDSEKQSRHDGIHTFHLEEGSSVKYIENHVGLGNADAERIFNPQTVVNMQKNSRMEMLTTQLGGVSDTLRTTDAVIEEGASLVIKERLLTALKQHAESRFKVVLAGNKSSAEVVSRSVARGTSSQVFKSDVVGTCACFGHVECDGILCDGAKITSVPSITAESADAVLMHEAAIGKISEEQQNKLMTLGLTAEEAEETIINGFLG